MNDLFREDQDDRKLQWPSLLLPEPRAFPSFKTPVLLWGTTHPALLTVCSVKKLQTRLTSLDFLGGAEGRSLPANTGTWVHPWSGKIPYAMGQLSL